MASIKLKFRTSSVQEKEGRLYYQVIHNRVAVSYTHLTLPTNSRV